MGPDSAAYNIYAVALERRRDSLGSSNSFQTFPTFETAAGHGPSRLRRQKPGPRGVTREVLSPIYVFRH